MSRYIVFSDASFHWPRARMFYRPDTRPQSSLWLCVCVRLGVCLVQGECTVLRGKWTLCKCVVCSVSGARGVLSRTRECPQVSVFVCVHVMIA